MENKPKILDIGCGRSKKPGAIGMDSASLPEVDIVHDLKDLPYPFSDKEFDEVIASHVLEHFDFNDMVRILNEIYRLLKPGGVLTVSVPHAFCPAAYAPQHRLYFTFDYFDQFDPEHGLGYYQDFKYPWKIERKWASVNLINDHSNPKLAKTPIVRRCSNFLSKVISYFARRRKWSTFADFLVRYIPLWLVSIHWKLTKPKNET